MNLRSPSGRQIYSLVVLATHPPLQTDSSLTYRICCANILRLLFISGNAAGHGRAKSPRGDSNPPTYRLQVGCATIAPLGRFDKSVSHTSNVAPFYRGHVYRHAVSIISIGSPVPKVNMTGRA